MFRATEELKLVALTESRDVIVTSVLGIRDKHRAGVRKSCPLYSDGIVLRC